MTTDEVREFMKNISLILIALALIGGCGKQHSVDKGDLGSLVDGYGHDLEVSSCGASGIHVVQDAIHYYYEGGYYTWEEAEINFPQEKSKLKKLRSVCENGDYRALSEPY